jgi:hypothetical protein
MTELDDTQPVAEKPKKKKTSFWFTALIVILILVIGGYAGYLSGISDRRQAATQAIGAQVDEQYQLGLKALESGLYQVALTNFQFVIQQEPEYPGVQDKLVEVLLKISLPTATLPVATPNVTSTPDTRGAQAIFAQAEALIIAQDWNTAIETLDALRKEDPTYRTVDVDGMYYIALMQRGSSKIVNTDCKNVNLEGGIYDLTLAERFGPLDKQSDGLRDWARQYITGASFWEIDWYQVYYYFEQLRIHMPYLMDSSCVTTTQRYRFGAIHYADSLLIAREYCAADQIYQSAMGIQNPDNSLVEPTAAYAYNHCQRTFITETTEPPPQNETPTPLPTEPSTTPTP